MRGAHVRVVGQEHVAGPDARVRAAVLHDPLDRQGLRVGEVLQVGAEEHQLAALGEDGRLEVGFYAKGPGKAQIALQSNKLSGSEAVEKERVAWKKALEKLSLMLS